MAKENSPFAVMQGCADVTGWDDNSQLSVALNFIYGRKDLWDDFREHCINQVEEEQGEEMEL